MPFAYTSSLASGWGQAALSEWLRVGGEPGLEWRGYRGDGYLRLELPDGSVVEANHRRREDLRFNAGLWAALALGRGFEIGARYDLVVGSSNVNDQLRDGPCVAPDYACHALDYGARASRSTASASS